VAVFSALKNKVKAKTSAKEAPVTKKAAPATKAVAKKAAPAKKAVAKKAVAKKAAPVKKAVAKKAAPVKKAVVKKAAPVKKIELKKDLTAKDVQQIVDAKNAVIRQNEVLAELESRGVTSINRIPKKVDKDLVDEARALAAEIPVMVEKLRKSGLGSPSRILKKAEYELIAPKPEPVKEVAPVKVDAKTGKAVVTKIDGEEVEDIFFNEDSLKDWIEKKLKKVDKNGEIKKNFF
jgi:RNA polymerase primary sigma factor